MKQIDPSSFHEVVKLMRATPQAAREIQEQTDPEDWAIYEEDQRQTTEAAYRGAEVLLNHQRHPVAAKVRDAIRKRAEEIAGD